MKRIQVEILEEVKTLVDPATPTFLTRRSVTSQQPYDHPTFNRSNENVGGAGIPERRLISAIILRARLDCGEFVIDGRTFRHAGNREYKGRNAIRTARNRRAAMRWINSESQETFSFLHCAALLGWSDVEILRFRADCRDASTKQSACTDH